MSQTTIWRACAMHAE